MAIAGILFEVSSITLLLCYQSYKVDVLLLLVCCIRQIPSFFRSTPDYKEELCLSSVSVINGVIPVSYQMTWTASVGF